MLLKTITDILTSSLVPVKPFHHKQKQKSEVILQSPAPSFEVDEFPLKKEALMQITCDEYVNHLYIYPKLLLYEQAAKLFSKVWTLF